MINASYINTMQLIRSSLWGEKEGFIGPNEYNELKEQSLVGLTANVLPSLNIEEDLYRKWKKDILFHFSFYTRYIYEQNNIPITVPYVILKGTSVAKYYPNPTYRTMGDIDIMTSHEDYSKACQMLLNNGYNEITGNHTADFGRHRCFSKNGIIIEIHAFFALLNDTSKAEWLDNEIIKNITPSHVLPDMINGLVLLEHINQHMEGGLGLRQIIDWMMFVDKCLDDKSWQEFRFMAKKLGMEQLARVTTKMCELYLGLPSHTWCQDIDDSICKRFMEYIISCGNFGNKLRDLPNNNVRVLSYTRSPLIIFRHMQERGLQNWENAKKFKILKPFAWMYQLVRYFNVYRNNRDNLNISETYSLAKERIALFDVLGVTQASKGYAIYKNNRYIKTHKRP